MITWEEVKKLIQEISGSSDVAVDKETRVMDDLKFDSMCVMELLTEIEEKFGVDFTDLEDFEERFNRCGDLYEGIVELMKAKES